MGARVVVSGLVAAMAAVVSACAISPNPLTSDEKVAYTVNKRSQATAGQEPLHGSVDLYEAMARAIKYNLDARVEILQRELKLRDFGLSTYKMLPTLVANTGFAARNNDSGGTSQSLLTGHQSLEASTSQDRRLATSDLTFSWNILDFGLSYVRARQAADEALIANESRRKAINRIVEDIRTAYWRAVSSEQLLSSLRALEGRVVAAIERSHNLSTDGQTSPITAITYERELVEIKREIQRLDGELKTAKTQLAALMNVDPAQNYQLVHKPHETTEFWVGLDADRMIEVALYNRPELAEVAYKQRINVNEAHAALLELLPGAQFYIGASHDSNSFLANSDWVGWGARASWNLLKVFQYPARRESIDAADAMLHERALAMTMAIMTQVHVSRIRLAHTRKELRTADEYLDVQLRLIRQMRAQAASDKISEQTLIREEMNTLVAQVKRNLAYAVHQNAVGNTYSSLGLDPCDPSSANAADVKGLAVLLRSGAGWREGITTTTEVAHAE
jgi:outer membrane protein TolC